MMIKWIVILAALATTLPLCGVSAEASAKEGQAAVSKKPNVLLIGVDDLNDGVGFLGGHPNAKTPNLDRLAGRGTAFVNAHCTVPACNPSRVALLTGLEPHHTGVYSNPDKWPAEVPLTTLPHWFRKNGYRTLMVGKIFHHKPENVDAGLHENAGKMGGQLAGVKSPAWTDPFGDLKCVHKHAKHWGPLEGRDAGRLSDPKLANWAAKCLSEQKTGEPFLLMVGFHRPHLPFTARLPGTVPVQGRHRIGHRHHQPQKRTVINAASIFAK